EHQPQAPALDHALPAAIDVVGGSLPVHVDADREPDFRRHRAFALRHHVTGPGDGGARGQQREYQTAGGGHRGLRHVRFPWSNYGVIAIQAPQDSRMMSSVVSSSGRTSPLQSSSLDTSMRPAFGMS